MNFYTSKEKLNIHSLLSTLPSKFILKKHNFKKAKLVFFDTYDNRLFFSNSSFSKFGISYFLHIHNSATHLYEAISNKKIIFFEDIDDKIIRKKIKKIVNVRALLPKLEVFNQSMSYNLLSSNEKIVATLVFDLIKFGESNKSDDVKLYISFIEHSKNQSELKLLKGWLSKSNLNLFDKNIYHDLLSRTNKLPTPYDVKISQNFRNEVPAKEAIRMVYQQLTDILKYNEEGILNDIDTEFLHDFRVSIRKIRSGLSELKGVLPTEVSNEFKRKFAELQKSTNHARDLDVLLLIREEYEKNLPPEFRTGLNKFFRIAKLERNREYRKLQKFILSHNYIDLIKEWESYISHDLIVNDPNCKNRELPIRQVSKKFIQKKFRQIISLGNSINDSSSDSDFHELRILCKKLRYLIEFFSSAFPEKDIEKFSTHLKSLQNNLGEFNDLSVQQHRLKIFLNTKLSENNNKLDAASIGALITLKYQRQKIVRAEFLDKFNEFSNYENFDLYKKLFL